VSYSRMLRLKAEGSVVGRKGRNRCVRTRLSEEGQNGTPSGGFEGAAERGD
jgi:hypothetical protein